MVTINPGIQMVTKRSQHREKKKKNSSSRKFNGNEFDWVKPIAQSIEANPRLYAHVLAVLFIEIARDPKVSRRSLKKLKTGRESLSLLGSLTGRDILGDVERSLNAFTQQFNLKDVDGTHSDEVLMRILEPAIKSIARLIASNPSLICIFMDLELLKQEFGGAGEKLSEVLKFLPALSEKAGALFPEVREQCYSAIFKLTDEDRSELGRFADLLMRSLFHQFAIPRIGELLENEPRAKVILPFLEDILQLVPPEASLNTFVAMICTPKSQLTPSKLTSIAIQELGGLYLKTAQVLSEMCPPALARELRSSQDAASGVFPSVEKSYAYLLDILNQADVRAQWMEYLELPKHPIPHFAAASVGAIYELKLNEAGVQKWGVATILIKIQRPGLGELLEIQAAHLSHIARKIQTRVSEDNTLGEPMRIELRGMCDAMLRGITQYFRQCSTELDFRREQINADTVRTALGDERKVAVPKYFQTDQKYLFMERMPGSKITRTVQTKYLERRDIADRLISSYLQLLFEKGIVWADPHPGNILLSEDSLALSMIDLNPCFVWDGETRDSFKAMLYRLLLRDVSGTLDTLYRLVSNPESLNSNRLYDDLYNFMRNDEYNHGTVHFITDFIRILAENSIDLRVEVQAAMRGLTQVALTATAISARNSFALELRKYFAGRALLSTVLEIGPLKVFRVSTAILFQHIKRSPEVEIGPTLDERDLKFLAMRLTELRRAGVCDMKFKRVSPEEHSNLKQTPDGISLITSSDLKLHIRDKVRPARVRYYLELPSSEWLRERQEFVKLTTLARNFAVIESLEQLRRKSLDDYWHTVEAWSKPGHVRTVNEVSLIGEVKIAAKRLFQLRFSSLWDNPLSGLSWSSRVLWRLFLSLEFRKEFAEQKFITSAARTKAHLPFATVAVGTVHRLRILVWEALLRFTRWRLQKRRFSLSLMPIGIEQLESIMLHNLGRANPEVRNRRRNPRAAAH